MRMYSSTSPGVGLEGVTCSGFGSAASAEGLSIYMCAYDGQSVPGQAGASADPTPAAEP